MSGYRLHLASDGDRTVVATCPSLPEIRACGDDDRAAVAAALGAVEEALANRIARAEDLPTQEPDPPAPAIHLPLTTALKVELYRGLRARGLTRADLMRRLGWHREAVDRLFRLDHASRTEQLEEAFAAIGLRTRIVVDRDGR